MGRCLLVILGALALASWASAFAPSCVCRGVRQSRLALASGEDDGEKGKFIRMGEAAVFLGPRAVVAGGMSAEQLEVVDMVLPIDQHTPLLAFTKDMARSTLEQVLDKRLELEEAQNAAETLSIAPLDTPVILLSGFDPEQIKAFIRNYKETAAAEALLANAKEGEGEVLPPPRVAFSRAMPAAMGKQMSRLLGEITDDHKDRLANMEEAARKAAQQS